MTPERENLVGKIRALFAKTTSAGCTEEEMATALTKARALMDAYAVTEEELRLTKEEKAILRREPRGAPDPHLIKWRLLSAVSKFCNCEGWRNVRRAGGNIEFCGLPADAHLASWLLETLTAFVQAELSKFLMEADPGGGERRDAIRSFVAGCCDRIKSRMRDIREQSEARATSSGRELVVVKNAAIKAKLNELNIRLSCCAGPCGGGDSTSYGAGRAAGDRASFGRPVSGRNAMLRLK